MSGKKPRIPDASYRLLEDEEAGAGLRRIVAAQIDGAIADLRAGNSETRSGVHEARKKFKKIRAVLRLVKDELGPVYAEENTWYRDTARQLAGMRDAEAMVEAVDKLRKHFGKRFPSRIHKTVRAALVKQRDAAAETNKGAPMDVIIEGLAQARGRVAEWPIEATGYSLIEAGLGRVYRAGCRGHAAAETARSAEAFHDWRKQVKHHWYHNRLLYVLWPEYFDPHQSSLKTLSDYLGDKHDLDELQSVLCDMVDSRDISYEHRQLVHDLAEERSQTLQQDALLLGSRIFAEKPKAYLARIWAYWHVRVY
ncbi:MAG: CHAD domain-containing protein [Candidatus Hydrogenedentes bacterium]|nr:CHAD domain-containing protein [Candidatus Hydrogenedentota bacterium]